MTVLTDIARETWLALCAMAPYLLLGFLMAGLLSAWVTPAAVERHLGGRGFWSVFKAALFGVPLPLCSCGVIPVAASLTRHGAGRGATTAFVISTPQTGVDSVLVTYALLGPVIAIFRPVAAFVSGLLGGMLVDAFAAGTSGVVPAAGGGTVSPDKDSERSKIVNALRHGFVALPRDIARPLLVGLLVAGTVAALIPDDFFARTLGTGLLPMLVMMAASIPIYVCATASVPMAAAMMLKGISPGAALVFLMTGPATNAAAIATFWKILGKRATILYLLAVAATALGSGLLLDTVFRIGRLAAPEHAHDMGPSPLAIVSAVALLGILSVALWPRRSRAKGTPEPADNARVFAVRGMTCSHCAATVRRTLLDLPGVRSADVDLHRGQATVSGDNLDIERMAATLRSVGFTLVVPALAGATPGKKKGD